MPDKNKLLKKGKRAFHYFILMAVSSMIVYFVLSVQAGSLNPASPVAGTMESLDNIYNVLFGTNYTSTASGKSDGNVLERLRCITDNISSSGSCN
jgi:hypothetical protein